jgi:hypothetical protein
MRPRPVLLAIAAIAGGVATLDAEPAHAQCSVFSRHPCVPGIMTALDGCTPLRFTAGLGGAVAGRPIAIRYVDNRNAE